MISSVSSRSAILVFGPTCVGKTALGIKIAQAIDGEILSIDSLQCYRHGAIVTAQPTKEEQAEVPHHLVGYLDAHEEPHDDFRGKVQSILTDLETRSKTAVLVGGSTSLTLPVLLDMSDRGYNIIVLVLQPPKGGTLYADRIGLRIEDMLEQGMLDEIKELHGLQSVSGQQQRNSGIWKTIGFPEMLPYITTPGDDVYRHILLTDGLTEMCVNSVEYGHHQLRWCNDTLLPQLDKCKIDCHILEYADFTRDTVASVRSRALELISGFMEDTKLQRKDSKTEAADKLVPKDAMSPQHDAVSLLSESTQSAMESTNSSTSSLTSGTSEITSGYDDDHTAPAMPSLRKSALEGTVQGKDQRQRVVCVFAGSSSGSSPDHVLAARSLAYEFHYDNVKLVYGGGTTGLMGVLASTLVSLSGPSSVHGIIPEALARYEATMTGKDVANSMESEYGTRTVVPDMHTRKKMMVDLMMQGGEGSGFIALSGGYGTLEECMEMITWKQLGIHSASVCILNSGGFYDGLLQFFEASVKGEGFVKGEDGDILEVAETASDALAKLYSQKLVGRGDVLKWAVA